jgi:hypothetical protein
MTIGDQRAQQEQEQAARFSDKTLIPDDPTDYRRDRVRDVVRTRYVALELMEAVNDGLAARGLEIEDVWSGVEASRRVVDAMPSGDVAVLHPRDRRSRSARRDAPAVPRWRRHARAHSAKPESAALTSSRRSWAIP